MKIYPNTKIYMICPANIHSGGPELCHQLVSQLLQFGVDASIFYWVSEGNDPNNPVDDFYKKYHLPYVLEIEDAPHNILILSEASNIAYYEYKKVRKILWWMSVDNYISNVSIIVKNRINNALEKPMPRFFYFEKDKTEHWVQSEYARQFLELNGVPKKQTFMVEDYINQTFWLNAGKIDLSKKENIVAFNPAKGFEITKRLSEIAPDINWSPIAKMTPEQVQNLLAISKVYIDFGNHPGKDRIPREAALSGCVVITGKRGAAANDIDINIPNEFKFGETDSELRKVIEKIREVFKNFDENYQKQNDYRKRILDDKPRFAKEVAAAFNITPPELEVIAVAQGLSDKGVYLIEFACRNNIVPFCIVDSNFSAMKNLEMIPFIKRYQNQNFYIPESAPNFPILIVSEVDAKFLYAEGRVNKFALLNPDDAEINSVVEKFDAASGDIIPVRA